MILQAAAIKSESILWLHLSSHPLISVDQYPGGMHQLLLGFAVPFLPKMIPQDHQDKLLGIHQATFAGTFAPPSVTEGQQLPFEMNTKSLTTFRRF